MYDIIYNIAVDLIIVLLMTVFFLFLIIEKVLDVEIKWRKKKETPPKPEVVNEPVHLIDFEDDRLFIDESVDGGASFVVKYVIQNHAIDGFENMAPSNKTRIWLKTSCIKYVEVNVSIGDIIALQKGGWKHGINK